MTTEEVLRRLALQDDTVVREVLCTPTGNNGPCRLGPRDTALVTLGVLVALGAPVISYQAAVIDALAAGLTGNQIVAGIIAAAPLVGLPRLASATPNIALALGYDIEAAFERYDPDQGERDQ
jgi:4-carboxymuconolactone decarboxylase